ncbi:P-loop containing nucleoside triphosphate hydrolase [Phytophthora cactorum]|nr:P-loop containing nucleoside triphosphate hydrolase [Phytophthora cactorum]
MSTATAMQSAAEQAEAEAQLAWEREMELAVQGRGRTRSRSILADDEDETQGSDRRRRGTALPDDLQAPESAEDADRRSRARCFSSREVGDSEDDAARARRRSCSFSALEPPRNLARADTEAEEDAESMAKRAASLSKIYLAGSAPVDVSKLQDDSKIVGVKKVEVVQPTGALSAAALDALSEGLQLSVDNSPMPPSGYGDEQLTEEQLEEKKMEEEEDHKLKAEKLSARRSLSVRASLFRNKMLKSTSRLLGNSEEGAKLEAARNVGQRTTGAEKLTNEVTADAVPVAPKKRHKLKLLLLGDSGTLFRSGICGFCGILTMSLWALGVGKTSLMRVFSGDEFSESMLATAGVDFKLRHINVADEAITLQIWDTAGQERFHRITATYYKGANGIVLVYDVSDRRSFDNVGYWMNNIRQYSSLSQMPAMLLVGNKIDLPNRVVTLEEGQAAASQYGCRFIETSAKTSENTNGALETIARDAYMISVNPTLTQRMVMDREKTLAGRRNKENCVIQ